ncbi:MAG: universal stress protein [Candidatus Obscuribacterales bacterium]|nr:universal stress protein [Candidatus Obscuribacterales bacterium]
MNILLAIDGSSFSHAAVFEVRRRPWPPESQVLVLTVVEPLHPEYAGLHATFVPLATEAQKELFDGAQRLVAETADSLKEKFGDEQVSFAVKEGFIKDQILETANDWPADLIVLGSHGRKGITKFLLGSVSEGVLAHAPCSVEIVKIRPHGESH